MRLPPKEAAIEFVHNFFPTCEAALLCGSVVRKEATPYSDLDIIIFDNNIPNSYRESFRQYGWPIEAFVYNETGFWRFVEDNVKRARPSLARMAAEGKIIRDAPFLYTLQEKARLVLGKGPSPWSNREIIQARYGLTDILEDLQGSNDEFESLFIVNRLSVLVHEFLLRTANQWIGDGKWIMRALKQYDPEVADEFAWVFQQYYKNGDKEIVVEYVDRLLEPYGGRFFAGFTIGK